MSTELWTEAFRERVMQAFGPAAHWSIEQGRGTWREPHDGDEWSRALVIVDDGQPVAVAGAFHPRIHPTREWGYVEVPPAHRRQGYGRYALDKLRQSLPPTAGVLRGKVESGSDGAAFADRSGFVELQRTRTVRVDVHDNETPPSDLAIDSWEAGATVDAQVVEAWSEYYVAGHDWDPAGQLSDRLSRELFFRSPSRVLVASRNNTIVGVAFVGLDPPTTFVGGAVARDDPDGTAIAATLITSAASRSDNQILDIELDDWMWDVTAAIEPWPHQILDEAFIVAESTRRCMNSVGVSVE